MPEAKVTPHICKTSDGASITCLCIRGKDHDEDEFDVPLEDEEK